jgi:hypothetical protein
LFKEVGASAFPSESAGAHLCEQRSHYVKECESTKKKEREKGKAPKAKAKEKAQIRAFSSLPQWKPGFRALRRSTGGKPRVLS